MTRVPETGGTSSTLGQRIIFYATVTDGAVVRHAWLDPSWSAAITADPAYSVTDAQLGTLRGTDDSLPNAPLATPGGSGRNVYAWGSAEQLPIDRLDAFEREIGATDTIAQAETSAEYDAATSSGYTILVGNPNAWTTAERQHATARGLAVICEVYDGRPDTYSSKGVPPASLCFGVALDDHYIPLADYLTLCPIGFRHTFSVWHAAGLTDEDWTLIEGAT